MRRTNTITIEGDENNRDRGKVFIITEMAAIPGERWAFRLAQLLAEHGVNIPVGEEEGAPGMGAVAEATSQLSGEDLMKFATVLHDPTLEDWWACVKYQHATGHPLQAIEQGERCQIEEMSTIARLREEVMHLHLGFFKSGRPSTSASPSRAVPTGSRPTAMSRPRSVQSSPPGSPPSRN